MVNFRGYAGIKYNKNIPNVLVVNVITYCLYENASQPTTAERGHVDKKLPVVIKRVVNILDKDFDGRKP